MYVPETFSVADREAVVAFLRGNGFATLVSHAGDGMTATHVPLLVEEEGEALVLRGHMARANPHWRSFGDGAESLAIFSGPHGYVSPAWYGPPPGPPTWNYAAVHAYGVPRPVGAEAADALLDRLVATHEAPLGAPWSRALPGDLRGRLLGAIVAFEMPVTRLEAKFKLSQNRPEADRRRVADALAGSADAGDRALAELMRAHLGLES